ncbi:MAG: hypothetical protein JF610_15445 [Acidobacteria bacterium]|nr:hypothetical protein [Acidobacteriota bacterium]
MPETGAAPIFSGMNLTKRFVSASCVVIASVVLLASGKTTALQDPPEWGSAGRPLIDCAKETALAINLSRDMFRLKEQINLLEGQAGRLRAVRHDPTLEEDIKRANAELLADTAHFASNAGQFKSAVNKLPFKVDVRTQMLKQVDNVTKVTDNVVKTAKRAKDIEKFAESDVQPVTYALGYIADKLKDPDSYLKAADKVVEVRKEMAERLLERSYLMYENGTAPITSVVDSELALQAVEASAETVNAAGFLIAGWKWAVDKTYVDGVRFQDLVDENAILDTLNVLRNQQANLTNQAEFVLNNCPIHGQPLPTENTRRSLLPGTNPAPPSPPRPPAAPPSPSSTTKKGLSSGAKAGVLTATVGAGGLLVVKADLLPEPGCPVSPFTFTVSGGVIRDNCGNFPLVQIPSDGSVSFTYFSPIRLTGTWSTSTFTLQGGGTSSAGTYSVTFSITKQ